MPNVLSLHVPGECQLQVDVGFANGQPDQPQILGVSVDGVDITVTWYEEPVYTDAFGDHVPFDEAGCLGDAIIQCQLVYYDDNVLSMVRARTSSLPYAGGGLGADGTYGYYGALWGAAGFYFLLRVLPIQNAAIGFNELPWTFYTCRLKDASRAKHGTKRTAWDVTFYASGYPGRDDESITRGNLLYSRP